MEPGLCSFSGGVVGGERFFHYFCQDDGFVVVLLTLTYYEETDLCPDAGGFGYRGCRR